MISYFYEDRLSVSDTLDNLEESLKRNLSTKLNELC